jgi:hypothetical protein
MKRCKFTTQAEYSLYNLQQGTGLTQIMTQQWAENEYADGQLLLGETANTFNGS